MSMLSKQADNSGLINRLPKVRGRYTENAPLGASGWFKCGGTAEVLFKPADLSDLQEFLANTSPPKDAVEVSSPVCYLQDEAFPVHVFGALSNTIIRDGGLPGVTIRLGREFADIGVFEDMVSCGALALDANVANVAADAGLGGLEFFSGIPGTIGGALRMNAGCYGVETKDVLIVCEAFDRYGNSHVMKPEDMGMTYRHTNVPDDYIFVCASFRGERKDKETVQARMAEIKAKREAAQPIREKTGGSTFANPSAEDVAKAGLPEGTKVWQLIDQVGGRGLKVGGAMMSEKHCNFMINSGSATAQDLENLGDELIRRVSEKFGITLRWEIKRVGKLV
jgi:UDP-N-acetylmuramate dehydrogenase